MKNFIFSEVFSFGKTDLPNLAWSNTQLTFTCLKSPIETLTKGVKYVQS